MTTNYDSTIYYFLGCVIISAAVIIFLSRKASLYSYGTISSMLFILAFLIYSFIKNQKTTEINMRSILGIIEHGLPIVILLFISTWLFFINIKYFDRIQNDNLSPDYVKYEYFSLGFFIIQIIILMQFVSNLIVIREKGKTQDVTEEKLFSKKMRAGLYLLSLFNAIFVSIMHVIVAYFVTDG
jgi:hypothetical protein